jgi:ABC-type transport system substrate-binding protein
VIGRSGGRVLASACALVLLAAGCTSTPPPARGPTSVQATPTSEQTPNQIVIGVDAVTGGFNPHNLADVSTTTTALSQLLLPSVFRPGSRGQQQLDKTLMRSAKVISQSPFTVAYTIRPDASWSDGAPIAAEDFGYLADQMRAQPGTVNPAGYRLISDVESHEGGKRVVVKFSDRYPGWRSLFTNLLPSHLLKDIPGGWQGAMESSYPAYGGPFAIKSVDLARGEILVERNERYWEKPSAVDQLVLRRTDQAGPAAALRKGHTQFALTRTDAGSLAALRRLGKRVELHTVERPFVAEVLLRPARGPLADDDVRAAVAAMVDRAALIRTGAAGGPSSTRHADAQVLAPSERPYARTLPADRASPDRARAAQLLSGAGYTRDSDGWQTPGSELLSLVIASPGDQEPYASMAVELAKQLTAAGVQARAVQPDARELYGEDPADPDAEKIDDGKGKDVDVDIVVGPRAISSDPASAFASRFACRTTDASDDADTDIEPGNVAGFCDEGLQNVVQQTLTGTRSLQGELGSLEPRLWQENVTIPLYQLADTLALSKDVAGVTEGPPLAGPFGAAVNWIRISE